MIRSGAFRLACEPIQPFRNYETLIRSAEKQHLSWELTSMP
jgi:hypothetical protein